MTKPTLTLAVLATVVVLLFTPMILLGPALGFALIGWAVLLTVSGRDTPDIVSTPTPTGLPPASGPGTIVDRYAAQIAGRA